MLNLLEQKASARLQSAGSGPLLKTLRESLEMIIGKLKVIYDTHGVENKVQPSKCISCFPDPLLKF
jgi:hypothetical protein